MQVILYGRGQYVGWLLCRCQQSRDAGFTLGTAARVSACQVVKPFAGMRIQEQKALGLLLQRADQGQQGDVLVHVGEVAGVKAVAILHVGDLAVQAS